MVIKISKINYCLNKNLIIDTEVLYTVATQNLLNESAARTGKQRKTYTWDVKQTLMGLQREIVATIIIKEYDLDLTPEEYIEKMDDQINNLMCSAKLLPGASRLIKHLHQNDVPIALATSSGAESVAVKTTNHQQLFSLFHHKVMGSSDPEVKNGKPAPDIFLIAAKRFDEPIDPKDCLVFEDAPNGVKAAVDAGMQVVMVPDEHMTDEFKKGATLVLKSLEDFKPEYFGLPPFEKN
ncbi:unnamed protein product [Sphagnum compactum]